MPLLFKITAFFTSLVIASGMAIEIVYIYKHFNEKPAIAIMPVENKVQIGALAGNRNIEFGVKNILEELVAEKGHDLDELAVTQIKTEILFLDVLKTQSNLSVFHSNKEAVVIRLRGKLIDKGKVIKSVVVEEQAEEVSMSTLLIDEGGKFNQTNLSTALKKASNSLINKLL
jgi:uncharacterized pyridoxamine 5'-phosphate oxidase family protein